MVEHEGGSLTRYGKTVRVGVVLLFVMLAIAGGILFLDAPWADVSYPLDDAWIHMVYARNLVEGHGLSYNPPEAEAGFTSPLWLAFMAGTRLFSESVLAPKGIGLLFLVLLALVAYRLGGFMAGLLITIDPLMYFTALSGMEVVLFGLLALLALERTLKERFAQAGLVVAAALITRPEGALLCPLLVAITLIRRGAPADGWKTAARLIVPGLIAAGAWMLFCLHATGRPFPNTFYVKTDVIFLHEGADLLPLLSRFLHDLYALLADEGPFFPLAAGILIPLACTGRRSRTARIVTLLGIGLFAGAWCTRTVLRIDAFYWERYFIPVLVCVHVIIGLALKKAWRVTGGAGRIPVFIGAAGVIAILCINADGIRERYLLNCRDIACFNVAAGKWIHENTPEDAVVAVQDAGAIKYYGKRKIIDLGGLNDHALTDLAPLAGRIDIMDPLALALHAGAEWVAIFHRHYSGRPGFEIVKRFVGDDYSIYLTPERFTLLVLKKIGQKN